MLNINVYTISNFYFQLMYELYILSKIEKISAQLKLFIC